MFSTYYTAKPLLDKNALTSMCLSDRSDGKTLNIKTRGFENYLKDKSQFVYLRRWKSEITQEMYEKFYFELQDKVVSNEFVGEENIKEIINYEFMGTKNGCYTRKKGDKQWDLICYFVPLTMAGKRKSTFNVRRITSIEYDEFVPLDGRYIKSEMNLLMEFYKSIDRDRDKTRLNIFGNKIDPFNPFFDYFDIHMGIQKQRIKMYKDDTIAIEIYENKEHREIRNKSRFSTMIKGTKYEDYNNGGILNDKVSKIASPQGGCYFSSFMTELGEGCIYTRNDCVFVTANKRKDGNIIVDKIYNTGRKEYMCTFGNLPNFFKQAYKQGNLYYDSKKTEHIFEPLLNKIGGMK